MIAVSDAWKETHQKILLPETFVEITLDVVDVDATGTITCNNEAMFSKSAKIINNQDYTINYGCTFLEHNLWVLDGSYQNPMNFTNNYSAPGYVSDNDEDVTLTIALTNTPTEIPGFTIIWSKEYGTYATEFTLLVKNGDIDVKTITVTDNTSNVSKVELPVSDYDTVVLSIQGWSAPEQRRRVESILFGQKLVFTKNEILDYSHEQTGDPLGAVLTKNAIEFSIDNSNGLWNILNPNGMMRFLCERQPVRVRYGLTVNGAVEWINVGAFYLSEWRAQSDGIAMNFAARDVIGLLLNAQYSRTKRKAYVYFAEIDVYDSDGNVVGKLTKDEEFEIIGALKDNGYYATTVGYIKPTGIGINTTLHTDMRDAIWSATDVPLMYATYFKTAHTQATINSEYVGEFVQKCLFSHGYTMWFDQQANRLYLSSPKTTLSDYTISLEQSYIHPEVELSKPLQFLSITAYYEESGESKTQLFEDPNVKNGDYITIDCPYNQPVFNWGSSQPTSLVWSKYKKWWGYRERVSGEFRADPRLELFDVVTVETKYGRISPVMLTYLKYTYNGSFRANFEGKCCGEFDVVSAEE